MNNISVLIVDDDLVMRESVVKALKHNEQYAVRSSFDGFHALELIREHAFDVVITDMKMPGMTGLELLREIKKINIKHAFSFILFFSNSSCCS